MTDQKSTERDKSLPLHTKYRPLIFSDVFGNESTIAALKVILDRKNGTVRAFLFYGPSGSGKTTLARIVANQSGCSSKNFHELDVAKYRGIDTVREISDACQYGSILGDVKVYLLDEAHKLTGDAQNALLKLMEDTPKNVRIILCTTEPDKIIKTLRGRCSQFAVTTLRRASILKLIKKVCAEEEAELGEKLLLRIADCAEGCPRDALRLLDSVIDIENEELACEMVTSLSVNEMTVLELCQELLKARPKWETVAKIIAGLNDEPEKIRYGVLTYMCKVLMSKPSDRAATIIDLFEDSWMYSGKASLIQRCYLACK